MVGGVYGDHLGEIASASTVEPNQKPARDDIAWPRKASHHHSMQDDPFFFNRGRIQHRRRVLKKKTTGIIEHLA